MGSIVECLKRHPDPDSRPPARPKRDEGDRLQDTYTRETGVVDTVDDMGGTILADRRWNGGQIFVPFRASRSGIGPYHVGMRVEFVIERREAREVKTLADVV